jgi:hypothetical protein
MVDEIWTISRKTTQQPGLPDGIILDQTEQFGQILDGLAMEVVGIFTAIWPSL